MGLDIVAMVIEIETVFGVPISDADAKRMSTVGDLYDHIGQRIAPDSMSPEGGPYEGELWNRYLDVLEKETGLRRDRLRPGARFVKDLGLD